MRAASSEGSASESEGAGGQRANGATCDSTARPVTRAASAASSESDGEGDVREGVQWRG